MRKLSSILFLCLLFLLFSSCERPDLTDDVEWAYGRAVDLAGDRVCSEFYGDGECNGHNVIACSEGGNAWYEVEGTDIKFYCEDGDCSDAAYDLFDYCNSDSSDYGDTSSDYGDTSSDYGDTSSDSSSGSCTTIDGYTWSSYAGAKTWYDAIEYCSTLDECGYSDWHLPTISELRMIIKNCPKTEIGGTCSVSDPDCLFNFDGNCYNESCEGCGDVDDYASHYSKLGNENDYFLWSSSTNADWSDVAWRLDLYNASIYPQAPKDWNYDVRCVR